MLLILRIYIYFFLLHESGCSKNYSHTAVPQTIILNIYHLVENYLFDLPRSLYPYSVARYRSSLIREAVYDQIISDIYSIHE